MVYDVILLRYPTLIPSTLLILGTVFYANKLLNNHKKTYWNLFLIAFALLALSSLLELTSFIFSDDLLMRTAQGAFAVSALIFAGASFSTFKGVK